MMVAAGRWLKGMTGAMATNDNKDQHNIRRNGNNNTINDLDADDGNGHSSVGDNEDLDNSGGNNGVGNKMTPQTTTVATAAQAVIRLLEK